MRVAGIAATSPKLWRAEEELRRPLMSALAFAGRGAADMPGTCTTPRAKTSRFGNLLAQLCFNPFVQPAIRSSPSQATLADQCIRGCPGPFPIYLQFHPPMWG